MKIMLDEPCLLILSTEAMDECYVAHKGVYAIPLSAIYINEAQANADLVSSEEAVKTLRERAGY